MIKQKQSHEILNRISCKRVRNSKVCHITFICRQVCEENISVVAEMSEIIWQMFRVFSYWYVEVGNIGLLKDIILSVSRRRGSSY